MNALVLYEVDNQPDAVKKGMIAIGYHTVWMAAGIRYELPNNSLWKPDTTLEQAYSDINLVVNNVNRLALGSGPFANRVLLIKCIVVSNNPWVGLPSK
jgi:hypothetical protein